MRTWSPRSSGWSVPDDELAPSPHAERGIPGPRELLRPNDVRVLPVYHHDVQPLHRGHERPIVRIHPAPGCDSARARERLPLRPQRRRLRIPRSAVPGADDRDAQLPGRHAGNPSDAVPADVPRDVRAGRDFLHGLAPRARDRRPRPLRSGDALSIDEHRGPLRHRAPVVPLGDVPELFRLDRLHAKPRRICGRRRGKEFVDLQRSGTYAKMFFSFVTPLLLLSFTAWFVRYGLQVPVGFNTVFYAGMVGFFGVILYNWMNNVDATDYLATVPASVPQV